MKSTGFVSACNPARTKKVAYFIRSERSLSLSLSNKIGREKTPFTGKAVQFGSSQDPTCRFRAAVFAGCVGSADLPVRIARATKHFQRRKNFDLPTPHRPPNIELNLFQSKLLRESEGFPCTSSKGELSVRSLFCAFRRASSVALCC